MSVWDNQQETSWFAGILEAEGCCQDSVKARVCITNTDTQIIDLCCRFLDARTIFYSVTKQQPKNPKYRVIYNVCICGQNECYTLVKTLGSSFQCRLYEFLTNLRLGSSTTTRDTTLVADVYWLLGLFEGEGWFALERDNRDYYNPVVALKNTNQKIIEKCVLTLRALGCSWHVSREVDGHLEHSPIFSVRVRGLKRCCTFLQKMRHLFRTQWYSSRAELLWQFCQSRLMKSAREPYSETEHRCYKQLKLKR